MWRLTIVLLFASIISVRTEVNFGKVISNITSIVRMYDSELDKAVPFREMRASLVVLDSLALNYRGNYRQNIADASKLGYRAADVYYEAIDKMFGWCVKADMMCDFIINKKLHGQRMLMVSKHMLRDGLDKILASLKLLEEVRLGLMEMRSILRPVPSALQRELWGAMSDYEGRRGARVRAVVEEQERRDEKAAISVASGIALALLGPIGMAVGAGAITYGASIPRATLNSGVEAREAREFAIVEKFMISLMKAVDTTVDRIRVVKDNLNSEIMSDQGLRGFTSGEMEIVEYMEHYPMTEIKKLKTTVRAFINRHGGITLSRQRREVLSRESRTSQWEDISHAVNRLLDATAQDREVEYWTLKLPRRGLARFLEN